MGGFGFGFPLTCGTDWRESVRSEGKMFNNPADRVEATEKKRKRARTGQTEVKRKKPGEKEKELSLFVLGPVAEGLNGENARERD